MLTPLPVPGTLSIPLLIQFHTHPGLFRKDLRFVIAYKLLKYFISSLSIYEEKEPLQNCCRVWQDSSCYYSWWHTLPIAR